MQPLGVIARDLPVAAAVNDEPGEGLAGAHRLGRQAGENVHTELSFDPPHSGYRDRGPGEARVGEPLRLAFGFRMPACGKPQAIGQAPGRVAQMRPDIAEPQTHQPSDSGAARRAVDRAAGAAPIRSCVPGHSNH